MVTGQDTKVMEEKMFKPTMWYFRIAHREHVPHFLFTLACDIEIGRVLREGADFTRHKMIIKT
jgi:hypothetical protein